MPAAAGGAPLGIKARALALDGPNKEPAVARERGEKVGMPSIKQTVPWTKRSTGLFLCNPSAMRQFTSGKVTSFSPRRRRKTGRAIRWKALKAADGLPDKPRTGIILSFLSMAPPNEAEPGRIVMRSYSFLAPMRSYICGMESKRPTDTPPVLMITSASSEAEKIRAISSSVSSELSVTCI